MISKAEILIYNLTKQKIPSKKFFCELIKKALAALEEKNKVSLSLIFISLRTSQQLNSYWRNKKKAASVLSFPLQEGFPIKSRKEDKSLGDIFLCPEEIELQAQTFKIPIYLFYKKLIIHSLLHLYGYRHSKARDREKMERLEDKIFRLIKNK